MDRTETPSLSLPWPPPTPFALYAYDGRVTADLVRRLMHVHGTPIRHPDHGWKPGAGGEPGYEAGVPLTAQQIEERVKGVLEDRYRNVAIVPPGGPVKGGSAVGQDPPLFEVHGFHDLPTVHVEADGREIRYGLFSPPLMPYLYLKAANHSGNAFDVRARGESDRFMATTAAVARCLAPTFIACDHMAAFQRSDLRDPRRLAWGATYYGPGLVDRLGRDRLSSAPAWKVHTDPELGGMWVVLDELPFVESDQRSARQEAVEEHLGLRERFP